MVATQTRHLLRIAAAAAPEEDDRQEDAHVNQPTGEGVVRVQGRLRSLVQHSSAQIVSTAPAACAPLPSAVAPFSWHLLSTLHLGGKLSSGIPQPCPWHRSQCPHPHPGHPPCRLWSAKELRTKARRAALPLRVQLDQQSGQCSSQGNKQGQELGQGLRQRQGQGRALQGQAVGKGVTAA